MRPKGVVDGQQVNIPALPICIEYMGTHDGRLNEQMEKFVPQGGVKLSSEVVRSCDKKSHIGA